MRTLACTRRRGAVTQVRTVLPGHRGGQLDRRGGPPLLNGSVADKDADRGLAGAFIHANASDLMVNRGDVRFAPALPFQHVVSTFWNQYFVMDRALACLVLSRREPRLPHPLATPR
jgi:hypothetical protein